MKTKVEYLVVYPRVDRPDNCCVDPERMISGNLNIYCDAWKTNTAIRMGFCDRIFAGMNAGSQQEFPWFLKAHMRSMSVGDLIYIDPEGLKEWWICESCGWGILTDDEVDSWLNYPRKYGCDMFELNEWMKENNLAK